MPSPEQMGSPRDVANMRWGIDLEDAAAVEAKIIQLGSHPEAAELSKMAVAHMEARNGGAEQFPVPAPAVEQGNSPAEIAKQRWGIEDLGDRAEVEAKMYALLRNPKTRVEAGQLVVMHGEYLQSLKDTGANEQIAGRGALAA